MHMKDLGSGSFYSKSCASTSTVGSSIHNNFSDNLIPTLSMYGLSANEIENVEKKYQEYDDIKLENLVWSLSSEIIEELDKFGLHNPYFTNFTDSVTFYSSRNNNDIKTLKYLMQKEEEDRKKR